jgi:FkbM family methyltransferase
MGLMKRIIGSLLGNFGLEVRRIPPVRDFDRLDAFSAQKILFEGAGKAEPVIFDVGAHRGVTARRYRRIFRRSPIYCFEPNSRAFARLRAFAGRDGHITAFHGAVAESAGHADLNVNEPDTTSSLFSRPHSGRRYNPKTVRNVGTERVETISLDGFVEERGLECIDILKLDVQGGELAVLRGARRLLDEARISLIYTEFMIVPHYEGGALLPELWQYLSGFGYTLYNMYNPVVAANGQLRQGDGIFVSRIFREKVIDRFPEEP